jgi:hypothetical protein
VLVADMAATTQFACADADRLLLVAYGDGNLPPLARDDQFYMLPADGSVSVPFDTVLANDYDPEGAPLEVVGVGSPGLPVGGGRGTNEYGSTTADPVARQITYTLPAALPADWTGRVAFAYGVRDQGVPEPAEATAMARVAVAPHLVQDPEPGRVETRPNTAFELAYRVRYAGTLESLSIAYTLPLTGSGAGTAFWPYLGGYSDDAGSAPAIDPGTGSDGVPGTVDDTGVVRLDFGTAVPPSGTRLRFRLQCPLGAAGEVAVGAQAEYRLAGSEATAYTQPLAEVVVLARGYVPEFTAGPGGTVTVEAAGNSYTATAVPALGFEFARWLLDGAEYSTANPLVLSDVATEMRLTAEFRPAAAVEPEGSFLAVARDVEEGWWHLSGRYAASIAGNPVAMAALHGTKGKIGGLADLTVGKATVLHLPIKGSAKGSAGALTVKLSLKGADPARTASASLALNLVLHPEARQLVGPVTGSITVAGTTTPVAETVSLDIPAPMDGTWTLAFQLARAAKSITGTAMLTLSDGVECPFLVKGRPGANGTAALSLAGDPADPDAKGIKIKTTITPFGGGRARLDALSGKGYGQTLKW